jgi:hypothetical protein
LGGHGSQQRHVELGGDLRQLVGCGAGGPNVGCREDDLDVGGQQPRPGEAILCLVRRATDGRRGGIDLPWANRSWARPG